MLTKEQTSRGDLRPIEILRQGVDVWNRWRSETYEPYPDLRGAQLSGVDLYDANLNGVVFVRADLSGSNFLGATLIGADLCGANLSGAKLSGVDLSGAILVKGILRGANLSGANLFYADLFLADLKDAILYEANLRNTNLFGAILSNADLREATLFNTILGDAQIDGTILLSPLHHPMRVSDEVRKKFDALVEQWRQDTSHISITSRRYKHPAYLQLIDMGEQIIPLLLKEIQQHPDFWFHGLRTLTHEEDPARGAENFNAAAQAWIDWGKERGLC